MTDRSTRRVLASLVLVVLAWAPRPRAGEVGLFLDRSVDAGGARVTAIAFAPARGVLAYGDDEGGVYLVDTGGSFSGNVEAGGAEAGSVGAGAGDRSLVFRRPGREITAIAFSPGGDYLAVSAGGDGVWLVALPLPALAGAGEGTGEASGFEGAKGRIDVLAFSGDGRYLAGGGEKEDVFVWEAPSGRQRARLEEHEGDILALAFDGSERTFISAAEDGRMNIYDASSFSLLRRYDLEAATIPGSGVDITAARFSPDRHVLAVATDEHIMAKGARRMIFEYHIAFFDVSKGVHLKTLEAENGKMSHIALYPGNCFVAFDNSTMRSGSVGLRDIESGELSLSYPTASPCRLLEFSPDGRHLAGAVEAQGGGDEVLLWSVDYEMPASGCFTGRLRLASTAEPVLGSGGPWTAAVLPFAGAGADADLGRAAAHFLESALSGNRNLRLIERSRVDDIIRELELQSSGMVDESTAVEMGRLLGAGLIITGNIDRAGSDLVISSRIIEVGTGEILGTRQVHCGQCGADDIFDAVDILARTIVAE